MHLLIAREAVDQHLQVAGDVLEADGDLQAKAQSARAGRARSTRSGCRSWRSARASSPARSTSSASSPSHLRYAERGSRKLARSTFYAMGRWQAKLEQRQAVLGRIVDIGAELFAIASAVVYADTIGARAAAARQPRRPSWPTCSAARRAAAPTPCSRAVRQRRRRRLRAAQAVLDGRYAWIEEGVLDPADA